MQQSRSRAQTCICRAAVLDLCVASTVTMLVKLYVLPKGSMEKDSGDDSVPYGTFVLNIISCFFIFNLREFRWHVALFPLVTD